MITSSFKPLYMVKMGPFFVSSSFLHFKEHQNFRLTWSLLGWNRLILPCKKWCSTTRVKLNYTTTSAGCYKDWWLSKEWWQELRVSLETTLYMSTIIKYSKAVITSQLFFCIENLQFSFEKVLIIVDTYQGRKWRPPPPVLGSHLRPCLYWFNIYGIVEKKYSCKNYKH